MSNRETWMRHAANLMAPWFAAEGYPLPKIRMACGFPSVRSVSQRNRRIGECWNSLCSEDETFEIMISPTLDDPIEVLATLAHELVHAAVGLECGHKGPFRKVAKAIGLAGPMTATHAGDELRARFETELLPVLGDYPHARLNAGGMIAPRKPGKPQEDDKEDEPVSSGPRKQTARMMKVVCPDCGYTVRTTRKWIEKGLPVCCCGAAMVAEN